MTLFKELLMNRLLDVQKARAPQEEKKKRETMLVKTKACFVGRK